MLISRALSIVSNSARSRSNFRWFLPFQTRFLDNDKYGHMNNAVYHGIFDSVINIYLIRHCGLDTKKGPSQKVGFMVTNKCEFFAPAMYPDIYLVGLRLAKMGKTSLHCQLGIFPLKSTNSEFIGNVTHGYFPSDPKSSSTLEAFEENASTIGEYVHVVVDPGNDNKPTPIPEEWRPILHKLAV